MSIIIQISQSDIFFRLIPNLMGYPVEQYPYKMYPDTTMKYAWWFLRGPESPNDFDAFDVGLVNDIYSFRESDTLSLYIFDADLLESEVWVPTDNVGHFENEA